MQDKNQSPQLHRLAKKWNFICSKITYDTLQRVDNKGADQTARMRRLVCACVVLKLAPEDRFSRVEAHIAAYTGHVQSPHCAICHTRFNTFYMKKKNEKFWPQKHNTLHFMIWLYTNHTAYACNYCAYRGKYTQMTPKSPKLHFEGINGLIKIHVVYIWAATCDFQQCVILTSVGLDEPVPPPFKLRNSKWWSVSSLIFIE